MSFMSLARTSRNLSGARFRVKALFGSALLAGMPVRVKV